MHAHPAELRPKSTHDLISDEACMTLHDETGVRQAGGRTDRHAGRRAGRHTDRQTGG